MCGICGFNWRDEDLLERMKDAVAHRGPDADGSYFDDGASLGHRRLSIVDLSENGQALDAIREVGPGSHFLGCSHTQANFETAFWRSTIADNNSFEQWRDDGGKDITQRANETWKRMLCDYEAPALDPALDEALQAFMAKRKVGLPDGVA